MAEDIRTKVAQEITKSLGRVETDVVDILVERDLKKKSEALVKVIDKLSEEEKEMRKLGPDNQQFDADGKKTGESFSKKRIEERNKTKGKITKLTNAINKALGEKGDFSDVYNLASGKDSASSSSGDETETDTEAS